MPRVELPNDGWASLKSKDELSERSNRKILAELAKFLRVMNHLTDLGFNPENEDDIDKFVGQLSDQEIEDQRSYQAVLATEFLKQWSIEGPLPNADEIIDQPKPVFDALVLAASKEYNREDEFGPDGAPDPKAPTANSNDSEQP